MRRMRRKVRVCLSSLLSQSQCGRSEVSPISMAAFRHISSCLAINILRRPNTRFHPPSQLVASRGLVSKLFIGVMDRSKGFFFVTFASREEADKAVSEMNGKILYGRTVLVDYARAKPPRDGALSIARPPPQPIGNK